MATPGDLTQTFDVPTIKHGGNTKIHRHPPPSPSPNFTPQRKKNWALRVHVEPCYWLHENVCHHFWPRLTCLANRVGT
jgi:hypothetical protein